MNSDSWRIAGNELQRIVSLALGIYGFFTSILPEHYPLASLSKALTQGIGLLLMILGFYLFVRKKPLFAVRRRQV